MFTPSMASLLMTSVSLWYSLRWMKIMCVLLIVVAAQWLHGCTLLWTSIFTSHPVCFHKLRCKLYNICVIIPALDYSFIFQEKEINKPQIPFKKGRSVTVETQESPIAFMLSCMVGIALPLICHYSVIALSLLCCCSAVALLLLCCCSAVALLLLCRCSAIALPLLCCCSVVALPLLCRCSVIAWLLHCIDTLFLRLHTLIYNCSGYSMALHGFQVLSHSSIALLGGSELDVLSGRIIREAPLGDSRPASGPAWVQWSHCGLMHTTILQFIRSHSYVMLGLQGYCTVTTSSCIC